MKKLYRFNTMKFYDDLNRIRIDKDLPWRAVFRECGVGHWSFTRLSTGQQKSLYLDNFVSILMWSGLNINDYIERG